MRFKIVFFGEVFHNLFSSFLTHQKQTCLQFVKQRKRRKRRKKRKKKEKREKEKEKYFYLKGEMDKRQTTLYTMIHHNDRGLLRLPIKEQLNK